MPALKLKIAGITCTAPILVSVSEESPKVFLFVWNFDGVDYSYDNTTTVQVYYSINSGVSYQQGAPAIYFPNTTTIIDMTEIPSEVFYFKVRLVNRSCNEDSNIIIYAI